MVTFAAMFGRPSTSNAPAAFVPSTEDVTTPTIENRQLTSPVSPKMSSGGTHSGVATPMTRTSSTQGSSGNVPPIGPPRGKLVVQICEARGLFPSNDPYVVCVFESNEFISRGPRRTDLDTELDDFVKVEKRASGSVANPALQNVRGIAIPMRSRQSSHNSLMEPKDKKDTKLTKNAQWDYDAVL
jgi:hypothetical protein